MAYTDLKNNKFQKNALILHTQKFKIKLDNFFILTKSERLPSIYTPIYRKWFFRLIILGNELSAWILNDTYNT